MFRLLLAIMSGILGLWAADQFVSGVDFTGDWKALLSAGLILGLINFFIKPILKLITLPVRFLMPGFISLFFSLLINIGIIFALDIAFRELVIEGINPLLWTTAIVWGLGILLPFFIARRKPKLIQK